MFDQIQTVGERLRVAALTAFVIAGLGYAATESPFVARAHQQPAPGTCCRYTTECNSGSECVTKANQTCSVYNQPNYCVAKSGGIVVPIGGDQ
jgi:hypothetical protein